MQKDIFTYSYSAKENAEVQAIRKKYLPKSESKLEELKRLDEMVQASGMVESLSAGIGGALIFGLGMCLAMQVIGSGLIMMIALMRFFLVLHTSKHKPGEKMKEELMKYRACGIVFLVMNLALTLIIFFMVYWNRTFEHHEITTIALAAYTFTSLTMAIMNVIKYRKYNSPVFSASKAISLAAACVSMLTLESTMLTTFSDGTMTPMESKIMLGCTGGAICLFIVTMAIYMIVQSSKKLKELSDYGK